jgi:hypothetical protein
MRRQKLLAVVVAATCLTGAGATALAATGPAGGPIQVFVTNISSTKAKILITGAIGDYGTTLTVDKNGKVDANGAYQKVTLKKGGFWINATALNNKLNKAQPVTNKATCSLVFTGSAATTPFDGTGAYQGIAGSVKITVTFAGISSRFTSGAHKGQCNFGQNAPSLSSYESIGGTGNVTFS